MAWKVGMCCKGSFFLILIFDSLPGIRTAYGLGRALLCTFPVCLSHLFRYQVGNSSEKVQTVCVGGFQASCNNAATFSAGSRYLARLDRDHAGQAYSAAE